jgi:hypothetical protein
MAIFKPEVTEYNGENKFLGINQFAIIGFEDKSGTFDWADLYLEVEVKQEFSDYTRKLQIKGSFDKDDKGKISGGSVLKRLYIFFEAIGCSAGLNVDGKWEDEKGDKIDDIADYLSIFSSNPMPDADIEDYPYIAYFYKELPKKIGGKAYTTVWPKAYKSTDENE